MKKISIVIPNYNNEKYLEKCLASVLDQDYPRKEIIIVDDGSEDNSVKIIRKIIKNNKKADIRLICQNNLNAAMARNNGMNAATGDYVLFLDSDDTLEKNILTWLIATHEENNADITIGGFEEIDGNDFCVDTKTFVDKDMLTDTRKNFSKLLKINPVPSNKLYDLQIIRNNNLEWGNVRIGQDLNFYVKYLLLCKKALIVSRNIYKYRLTSGSMSRTFDFRIFDIVNVFDDIKKFYTRNNGVSLYEQYVPALQLIHFDLQMSKQVFFTSARIRKLIVNYFMINEKKIDYSLCKNCDNEFKKVYIKFRMKCLFRLIFTSNFYCWCRRKNKEEIGK